MKSRHISIASLFLCLILLLPLFSVRTAAAQRKGWYETASGRIFYYLSDGKKATGWQTIGGKKYYFNSKGNLQTGWLKLKKGTYYLNPATGALVRGTARIGKERYFFTKGLGRLQKNCYTATGEYADANGVLLRKSTLKSFLKTALQPVGSTLYVWGGGWNKEDTGSGVDAVTMGVSPLWKKFFDRYGSSYDYRTTRYQIRNGLDCSGYVGWAIYNTFHRSSGNTGYVMKAQDMANTFAGYGWGSFTPAGAVKNYRAGDIMSTSAGHVYIVIGQCSDKSVVLLHSSPPGVQITGTCTPSGNYNSQAIQLATRYMKKYYPAWYRKFPDTSRGTSYLTGYSQMRWYLSGSCVMSDPDGYGRKTPAQILMDLFQ